MARTNHGVGAIITNPERSLFFVQQKDETYYPAEYVGHFSFFGGSAEEGETAYDALVRELREELPAGSLIVPRTRPIREFSIDTKISYEFSLFAAVMHESMLHKLAETPVNEGRGMLVSRERLLHSPFVYGLEEVARNYVAGFEFGKAWKAARMQGDFRPEFDDVYAAYSGRHYHSIMHVLDSLAEFGEAMNLSRRPGLLELAIFFHDYIHTPDSRDGRDEKESAARIYGLVAGQSEEMAAYARDLVLVTRHSPSLQPKNIDEQLICDIDLAVLGRPSEIFDDYERLIWEEYRGTYPLEIFRRGRMRILESFDQRDPIYCTEHFRKKYEASAHQNLKRSIERLSAISPQAPA